MQKLLTGEMRFPEFTDEWNEIHLGKYLILKEAFHQLRNP